MNILTRDNITFVKGPSGCLDATYCDAGTFHNVRCVPLFPLSDREGYVSVLRRREKEYEELGIIKDIGLFPKAQHDLVMDDLRFRYFVPEITEIRKVTKRSGLEEWDVATDKGDRIISIRDRKESVTLTDPGIVFVTDADKCRYKITDYRAMKEKSRVLVERMLM